MSTTMQQLGDLQGRIHQWCAEQFPDQTPLTILAHLEEEVAELGERRTPEEAADCLILLLAWAAHTDQSWLPRLSGAELFGQMAASAREMVICEQYGDSVSGEARMFASFLLALCSLLGWDLLAAAEAKHAVNLTRSWARGADGIHRHVEVTP